MPAVIVMLGSASDAEKVRPCLEILRRLGIAHEARIASAHRTPDLVEKIIRKGEEQGCRVFICAAGMAAHLAGAVAARTTRPVIGVPISSGALCGLDALFSTVQMPPGFPVATTALDQAGAKIAAWLAAEILALQDESLAAKIGEARAKMRVDIAAASEALARDMA